MTAVQEITIDYEFLYFLIKYVVTGKHFYATLYEPEEFPEISIINIDYLFEFDELEPDAKKFYESKDFELEIQDLVYTQVFHNEPWFKPVI